GHVESPPPPSVQQAIEAITALLSGDLTADLSEVQLDLSDVSPFESRVYVEARTIAAGETLTYGAIATRLGDVRLAREVGQALGRNPFPIIVPCHRVIAANGRLG